jgi:hypothetical protein
LKKARAHVSESLRLAAGLLVNSATLEKLCRMEPEEASRWLETGLKDWQRGVVGEGLRRALPASAEDAEG